jgi:hypothetical protein
MRGDHHTKSCEIVGESLIEIVTALKWSCLPATMLTPVVF